MKDKALVRVKGLKKYYPVQKGFRESFSKEKQYVKAIDDISFTINKGEILGLAGESGSGKTTTGEILVRLQDITEGEVTFDGHDFMSKSKEEEKDFRKEVQMIFQDPYASLNPRMTVEEIISEPLDVYKVYKNNGDRRARVVELLEIVGLSEEHAMRFPHEFSGGQRQRIGIARALALNPKFIVCDEPVSALDVSIQAQVLNLMKDLQEEFGLTYMFITHDLSVVKHFSDDIAVMYLGELVEKAPAKELFKNPVHPYTKALLSAIPIPSIKYKMNRERLKGEITSPVNPGVGCRFRKRCSMAVPECGNATPTLREISPGHFYACHLIGKDEKK